MARSKRKRTVAVGSSSSEDSDSESNPESDIQVTEDPKTTQKLSNTTLPASQGNLSTPVASQSIQSSIQDTDSHSNKNRKTTSNIWEHFVKKGSGKTATGTC
ncbi:hypothetical protein PGTUg99_020627 [Puccinia graminis f. sp. tritici]|uniref:Uncharacterized protein n=1 Tax=Puccinia graminis f. sp. tritici TaxID=56615 RepID=A0A5B0RXW1_PUCGR|nr:hypothetical protein PGTUg99_020627 [Puccinia graminis f. sp. tritici]